jgi:Fe-S oxidoreductase
VTTANLYDPRAAGYFDPVDARAERDRTFQICSDCRICVRFCPSFKDLFRMIDEYEDGAHDVKVLTDAQHEVVVDECYQCKLCFVVCPYTPGKEQEWVIDFPRLMLRSLAIEGRAGRVDRSAKLLDRTDLQGRVATTLAPIVNRTNGVPFVRGLMEKATGIAKDRLLPSYASVRFSKWFRSRAPRRGVLRHALARRGRRRQVRGARPHERRRARRCGARRPGRRGPATDVRVRAQERVPRLPRHR